MKSFSAAVLLLAACNAPRIEGSEARLHVNDSEVADKISALVKRVEPRIIAMLGTRWTRPYVIEVDENLQQYLATTMQWNRHVRLGPRALTIEDFEHTVAHELVHVHMRGPWLEMPAAVQEGVAVWVSLCALGEVHEYRGPEPTAEELRRVLSISNRHYLSLPRSETLKIDQVATWLASNMFPAEP